MLFGSVRQQAPQALILPQQSFVSEFLLLLPDLYQPDRHTPTEPNDDRERHQHGQDQCVDAEHIFHYPSLQVGYAAYSSKDRTLRSGCKEMVSVAPPFIVAFY
jgi:hypothetical protein